MKLSAILLFVACLQASAHTTAQTVTLKVKNAPVKEVFRSIQKQTGFDVLVDEALLQKTKPVTIDVRDMPVEAVLELCLRDQPIGFQVENNTIVIKTKPVTALVDEPAVALPIDISGKVTNKDGDPLAGASIKVKGKSTGTTTNADGVFVLKGLTADDVLVFSYTGFLEKSIKVGSQTSFIVNLEVNDNPLDEVVLKPYWSLQKKFDIGNSSRVTAKDIEKAPVSNPLLALQGRVTGVQITQKTGLNGGGVDVLVQGRQSINFGVQPLIIVDGVPYPSQLYSNFGNERLIQGGSPLNFINPGDIESIDILKDADATSIYGSRAANGAILITTKKGKAGKSKLSVNLQQGFSKVTRFADMLNTRQYLDMRYEAFRNENKMPSNNPSDQFFMPKVYAPDLTVWDTTRYTNWQKVLIGGTAKYTNINATMSGGTSAVQYLFGATYNRQTTVFPGDFDDKKYGVHFNINGSSANQKLNLQFSGSYMYDENRLPGKDLTATAVYLEPNAPALYNANGSLNWAPLPSGRSTWINPLAYTENFDFYNNSKNLISSLSIGYKLLPGLTVSTNMGFNNIHTDNYTPLRLEYYAPELRASRTRNASYDTREMNSWSIEPNAAYSAKIGRGSLDATLGGSLQKNSGQFFNVTASGFVSDQLMKAATNAPSKTVNSAPSYVYKYAALFGRLGYNWDGKYLVNLTARRDGSSRYGNKARFNNFWSIGAGWIFSSERWLQKELPFLSFGKLRASYGVTGNDQIPDYFFMSIYTLNNPTIPYQGVSGFATNNLPNPNLRWERTDKWQAGIDLGFFKDRIMIGATYSVNHSTGSIAGFTLPTITGFNGYYANLPATIRNTNWEFTLHTNPVKGKDFNWSSDFNLTIPQNKVVKFPEIEKTTYVTGNDGVIVGQPLGVIKVLKYAGVVDPATGQYLYIDRYGNSVLYPDNTTGSPDLTSLVTVAQKFYGGWLNSFHYKKWQLDFLFQFVRKIDNAGFYYGNTSAYPGNYYTVQTGSNQPVTVLNRWQKPGDNMPIALFSVRPVARPVQSSDVAYDYSTSFVRLKNVSLSWQLPANWLGKAKIVNTHVYFRGENLATITKFVGMDPESLNANTLPPLQTWTMGIKIDW